MYKKPLCIIKVSQVPLHLYQVIAGFMLLKKQGIIDLKIENSLKKLPYNMMEVLINDKLRVLYDLNDGYDNLLNNTDGYKDLYDSLLQQYDICFKRSYSNTYNNNIKFKDKIRPLGLNYMVTIKGNWAHNIYKDDPNKEKVKKLIRKLPLSQYYNNKYLVKTFEQLPQNNDEPKILFMARLWDPNGKEVENISNEKIKERNEINKLRIECIRKCREKFGDKFVGGITPSSYANEICKDIVINDKRMTNRDRYLEIMKSCDICIATTGLHESIGWKFGEYVAASKAIISEKLNYELPGLFEEGANYLSFNTVDECINNIELLIENKAKRLEIMSNNFNYYNKYVKPDKLVLNTLKQLVL